MRHNKATQMFHAFWWLFAMVMIYTYNGTLIASLTVPTVQKIIQSLGELSEQNNVLWTYRANTAHDSLFTVCVIL